MKAPLEFSVGVNRYRADPMDAFLKFDIACKLAPIATGALSVLIKAARGAGTVEEALAFALRSVLDQGIEEVGGPILKAISALPDADRRFIIKACLSVVSREVNEAWARIVAPNGDLLYADLDLPEMLSIGWKVIESQLLSFSFAPQRGSSGAPRGQP